MESVQHRATRMINGLIKENALSRKIETSGSTYTVISKVAWRCNKKGKGRILL